jgi:hypothetical protein
LDLLLITTTTIVVAIPDEEIVHGTTFLEREWRRFYV